MVGSQKKKEEKGERKEEKRGYSLVSLSAAEKNSPRTKGVLTFLKVKPLNFMLLNPFSMC